MLNLNPAEFREVASKVLPVKDETFAKDTENLRVLWNRAKGDYLTVNEEGYLVKMGVMDRIRYTTFSDYRKEVQNKVKNVIDGILCKLDGKGEQKDFISELFFNRLSSLSRKVYSRKLSESTYQVLTNKLLDSVPESQKAQMRDKTAIKVDLWSRLGNFSSLGGCSGSYRIIQGSVEDQQGKEVVEERSLGIFKPSSEETLSANNPKFMQRLKRLMHRTLLRPISGSLFHTAGGQSYLAEVAAKKVEEIVVEGVNNYLRTHPNLDERTKRLLDNIELVPNTCVANLKLGNKGSQLGSFQMWVHEKHEEAAEALGVNLNYQKSGWFAKQLTLEEAKAKLPAELFDLLVIVDYATGNSDRHGANWFFIMNEKDEVVGIRLIDGGWAMSPEHPEHKLSPELTKQYLWKNIPLSSEGFTDLGKAVAEHLHENQDRLTEKLRKLYTRNQTSHEEMEIDERRFNRMKDRIEVMEFVSKKGGTKADLAAIRTHKEIDATLQKRNKEDWTVLKNEKFDDHYSPFQEVF